MMQTTTNNISIFTSILHQYDDHLNQFISQLSSADPILKQAITYVLQMPSKKFRAKMVYATGKIYHIPSEILNTLALSIELIHAYSLVHDDLPAMDNDDWRRGQASCHKAFDEATAILTGNALHHLAFNNLLTHLPDTLDYKKCVQISQIILNYIGTQGILSGQSMDLTLLSQDNLTLDTLKKIHHLKTTTLLLAIVDSIWIAGSGMPEEKKQLHDTVNHLGLAYQMLDDYGDAYAPIAWGKNQSSDAVNQKNTFVKFFNKSELKQEIMNHLQLAHFAMRKLPEHDHFDHLITELEQKVIQS